MSSVSNKEERFSQSCLHFCHKIFSIFLILISYVWTILSNLSILWNKLRVWKLHVKWADRGTRPLQIWLKFCTRVYWTKMRNFENFWTPRAPSLETLEGRLETSCHLKQGFISGKFEIKNKNRKKRQKA